MSLLKNATNTIIKYRLLSKNDKVVIGVSGGPDSVALVFLLNSLKKTYNLKLYIAHLDHQLRLESYQDKEFVKGFANRLKLPFISSTVDKTCFSRKGSIEEIARYERLKFLFDVAKKVGAIKISLGHNQDDQAETVLMRLIRGTGLYGMSSILPKRKMGKLIIIRPLIETQRRDIESYLKRKNIKPCIDLTNKDSVFFRNRIRNKLIPDLKKNYNPNIKEVLANFAQIASSDYDFLEKATIKTLNRIQKYDGNRVGLELKKFLKLHTSIQRLVLRFVIAKLAGSTRRISFQHIKEIEDLIFNRPVSSIVDLPHKIYILKKNKHLYIYRKGHPNG